MTTNHDALTDRLRSRLAEVARRSTAISRDLRADHDDDWVERATELENDEVLEGLDEMANNEIVQLREALARIQQGRYGRCVDCDGTIDGARLEAEPTAARCLRCAEARH